jgi:hypothetical protein
VLRELDALYSQSHCTSGFGIEREHRFHKCTQSRTGIMRRMQEPILLLKIDTEGYERAVIAGATALLESRKVIALSQMLLFRRQFLPSETFAQVLNIIAELKAEASAELIQLLKDHGFHCLKYREQYGGILPSDVAFNISEDPRLLTIQHPHAADDEFLRDHPYVEDPVWGMGCDHAQHSSVFKDVEVSARCGAAAHFAFVVPIALTLF